MRNSTDRANEMSRKKAITWVIAVKFVWMWDGYHAGNLNSHANYFLGFLNSSSNRRDQHALTTSDAEWNMIQAEDKFEPQPSFCEKNLARCIQVNNFSHNFRMEFYELNLNWLLSLKWVEKRIRATEDIAKFQSWVVLKTHRSVISSRMRNHRRFMWNQTSCCWWHCRVLWCWPRSSRCRGNFISARSSIWRELKQQTRIKTCRMLELCWKCWKSSKIKSTVDFHDTEWPMKLTSNSTVIHIFKSQIHEIE